MRYFLLLTILYIADPTSASHGSRYLIRRGLSHQISPSDIGDGLFALFPRSGQGQNLLKPKRSRKGGASPSRPDIPTRGTQDVLSTASQSVASSQGLSRASFETDNSAKTAALHFAARARRREQKYGTKPAAKDSLDEIRSVSTTTSEIASPRAEHHSLPGGAGTSRETQPFGRAARSTTQNINIPTGGRTTPGNAGLRRVESAVSSLTSPRDRYSQQEIQPMSSASNDGRSDAGVAATASPARTAISAIGRAKTWQVTPAGTWKNTLKAGEPHEGQGEHPSMSMTGGVSYSSKGSVTASAKGRVVQSLTDTRAGGRGTLHMGMDGIPIKGNIGPGLVVPMVEARKRPEDRSIMVANIEGKGSVKIQGDV